LFFDAKKGYTLFVNELGVAYGEIEINKNGTGFVHTNDGYTILIENCDLNGALDGDKVIVTSIDSKRKDYYRGEICKVLKRKNGNILYEVVGNSYSATLIPCNEFENIAVSINKNELKNLVDGEIVLVNIDTNKINGEYLGEVVRVVGHKNDADTDIRMIYEKYNVPIEFSKEALEEAEKIPTDVSEEDIVDRVDLRHLPIITIDCDTTKDRDDALYMEKLPNGNFKLYNNISHISRYIKKGSKLYEEALKRRISHYPNNTCNPMFPPKISNGICSLNEGVDRLTRTFEIEVNQDGEIVDYKDYKSVINSRKQMKYSEVNRVLSGEKVDGYEQYLEQLKLLKEFNEVLEKNREQRGCIDFGIGDIEIKKNDLGDSIDFVERGDGLAERIIENCMLVTGVGFAEHYSHFLPLIYRVHQTPDKEVLENTLELLRRSGIEIPKYKNIDERIINSILKQIKNTEQARVIRKILLKSVPKARYDINNIGHFALQYLKYCQITSPIRRVDFFNHSLIDELENFDYSKESYDALENEIKDIARYASEAEQLSKLIEEEALAMEMAKYMEKHIGESYDAIVTEVYQQGMIVETSNHIVGKVKIENIHAERFKYDYDKRALVGKITNRRYRIGNKVVVIVKDACKETRTINFEIGKQKSLKK